MTLATAAYAFGNCTYYVATRFPNIYPYLGDAWMWVTNAKVQGYSILSKPQPDTVVVYGKSGTSPLGHVAVVDSVNADGSFNISEMNNPYNGGGYDVVDTRRSTMSGVVGFIVPPGSSYKPTTAVALYAAQAATGSASCLHKTSILGADVCFDGLLGISTMVAGGLLIVAGVVVFAAFALAKTGAVDRVASAAGPLAGPWGALASMAVRTSKPKAKPVAPTAQEGKAASDARVATARARLSSGTQSEVDAAKYGKGSKLSPEAREELNIQRSKAA